MSDIFDEADRLFIDERALAEARQAEAEGVVSPHDLYRLLTSDDANLERRITPLLFRNPVLRRQLAVLRDRLAVVRIPMLAAASDGTLSERSFPGGSLSLIPARTTGQTYLILRLTGPADTTGPLRLVATGPDGTFAARALPSGSEGEIMIILDNTNGDSALLRLLEDPLAEAALLPASLSVAQMELPE